MPAGRPSDYKTEYAALAYKFALLGATDKEMADFFDVSQQTLCYWKEQYPEFLESLREGKTKADAEVASKLFKRATGFSYDEVTWERVDSKENLAIDEDGSMTKQEAFKKKIVTKFVPPDVAAQNIWLKNRRRKSKVDEGAQFWTDKQETGFTDEDGNDLKELPIVFK